jgi:hypothetical protein
LPKDQYGYCIHTIPPTYIAIMFIRGSSSSSSNSTLRLISNDPSIARTLQANPQADSNWLMQAIVSMIALLFVLSIYQFLRSRYFKCFADSNAASHNASGIAATVPKVFSVSGDQRRAVLEAIYAENSKLAKDLDVTEVHKKVLDRDDDETTLKAGIRHEPPRVNPQYESETPLVTKDQTDCELACIEASLRSDKATSRQSNDDANFEGDDGYHTDFRIESLCSSETDRASNCQPNDVQIFTTALANDSSRNHQDEHGTPQLRATDSRSAVALPSLACGQAVNLSAIETTLNGDEENNDCLRTSGSSANEAAVVALQSAGPSNAFVEHASEFAFDDDAKVNITGDNVW